MKLYHYTSLNKLKKILNDKCIKTSPSNLLKPINPKIIDGVLKDKTDNYKPVVWFSNVFDFSRAKKMGLTASAEDKTEAAIIIDANDAQKWAVWATNNNIDKSWFYALKTTAPEWKSFYIIEHYVIITEETKIVFRPDIMKLFLANEQEV